MNLILCALQPVSPASPAARFAANRDLRRRSSIGHKVGQALVIATPDDTFAQVKLPGTHFSTFDALVCLQVYMLCSRFPLIKASSSDEILSPYTAWLCYQGFLRVLDYLQGTQVHRYLEVREFHVLRRSWRRLL